MKSKKKPFVFTVNLDAHMLSELVEIVNASNRHAAMNQYLISDKHVEMMLGDTFAQQCRESKRKLLKGDIAPHLDVCCCADTFAVLLTQRPHITYEACELPEDAGEDNTPIDAEIEDKTFAKLSKLPTDKLCEKLLGDDYCCSSVEYVQLHEADEKAQRRFYEALLSRFEAAAQYAKAIGSESARLWMEAICLLSPRPHLARSVRNPDGLDLVPDCVAKAYEVAQRAQRALWVDEKLRKLPTAKLPRKTSKPRR